MKRIGRASRAVLGGLAIGLVLTVSLAAPALATEDGEELGDNLSLGRALLTYVGIPLLIIAVIWVLASLPYWLGSPRYRPGVSWWAAPVWINGPDAAQGTSADVPAASGASDATNPPGGTSARW